MSQIVDDPRTLPVKSRFHRRILASYVVYERPENQDDPDDIEWAVSYFSDGTAEIDFHDVALDIKPPNGALVPTYEQVVQAVREYYRTTATFVESDTEPGTLKLRKNH